MKTLPFQFFATASDGAAIHVGHRLEQGGVQLGGMVGFGKREFGHRSVKLQLKALEENGVVDTTLGAAPTQDSIPQNKLDAFGLTIDTAIERVKCFEDFHARAGGLFVSCPVIAEGLPALKCRGSCGAIG